MTGVFCPGPYYYSTMENAPEISARKFLNRTNRHLFLTGRAGTGKTTFLHAIARETHKKAVIAAPTGVAAINAGGVTLHSLFQLPFGSYVPSDTYHFSEQPGGEIHTPRSLMRKMHMHATKRRLIQEMELLIIDEVSMLRADILDAIDRVMRSVRRQRSIPFGGIQVLFIGDLLQLPPVIRDDEWSILRNFYKSIHFFEALALKDDPPLYIELEKIYRQSDPEFINLLNHFRDNRVTREDVSVLNRYYKPGFSPTSGEGYIYLTTHNRIADEINRRELNKLRGETYMYEAEVDKEFREQLFPVDMQLELKEGAQVMFIKNDTSEYRQFFNGKIGTVNSLSGDGIEVGFNDGSDSVVVEKHTWFNKKYRLNNEDNEIREEIIGSYTHYPLKLAWAVTIHKSQGLTFEKAIIDVEKAFVPGQIYVALSRLTSLDGLVLTSPVPVSGFVPDRDIAAFASTRPPDEEIESILETETHKYVRDKLLQYFDFGDLAEAFSIHLRSYNKDEKRSAKQQYRPKMEAVEKKFKPLVFVSEKFSQQVRRLTDLPGQGYLVVLQKRLEAALGYFEPRLKGISNEITGQIRELEDAVGVKQYIRELEELDAVFFSKLQSLRKSVDLVAAIRRNEDLLRKEYSSEQEKQERSRTMKIVGKKKKQKSSGKGKKKARKKGDSSRVTFEMFRAGKTVEEIIGERDLKLTTIMGHLTIYVGNGEMEVEELIDEEKVSRIKKALADHYKDSIVPVKKILGDDCSYDEIRIVMAAGRV